MYLATLKEGDDIRAVFRRALEGVHLALYSIEKLGWSDSTCMLTVLEISRLDTTISLLVTPERSDLSQLRRRLMQACARLEVKNLFTWPLVVLRIRNILTEVQLSFDLESPSPESCFKVVCLHFLLYRFKDFDDLHTDVCSKGLHPLLQLTGDKTSLSLATIEKKIWASNVPDSEFEAALYNHMIPKPGILTLFAWDLLIESREIQQEILEDIRFQLDFVSRQALHQLILYVRCKLSLSIVLVQENELSYRLIHVAKPLDGLQSQSRKQNLREYLSNYLKGIKLESLAAVSEDKQIQTRDYRLSPFQKSIFVNRDMMPSVHCFEIQSSQIELISSICGKGQVCLFLQEFEKINMCSFMLNLKFLTAIAKIFIFIHLDSVESKNEVKNKLTILKAAGCQLGIYSDTCQDMFVLQQWQGTLFSQLMLAENWFQDLIHSERTLRGNCEARLRYLAQEGWGLWAKSVESYQLSAALIRLDFSFLEINEALIHGVSELTYFEGANARLQT